MNKGELDISLLLGLTSDLFVIIDPFGKVLFYSLTDNQLLHFLRMPLQKGELFKNIVPAESEASVQLIIDKVLKTKQSHFTEVEYKNPEGKTLCLTKKYAPLLNEAGEVQLIYILGNDITPQKIFEKKLVSEAKNINNLIERANAIIIGLDTRGYITDWNNHCSKITGYEKDEVYAKRFSDFLLANEQKLNFDDHLPKILNELAVTNLEVTLVGKQGQLISTLVNGTVRATAAGAVVGVFFVGQDVTELMAYRSSLEIKVEERTKELMKALKKEKEVVEMKNRFVSIASHEFRTPLSTIRAATNYIRQSYPTMQPEERNAKFNDIDKQINHMTHLLDDVLLYGKSDAGKIQLHQTSVVLNEFLVKIVEEIETSTKNTHKVNTNFKNLYTEIVTDEKLLRSILTNLLSNAIKFSPAQQEISFDVQCAQGQLIITVRDEGLGIPNDELTKIFEPFLRGKGAVNIDGTGLGLSIVKKAVELLDGSIHVESHPEKGTVFTVHLPDTRQ